MMSYNCVSGPLVSCYRLSNLLDCTCAYYKLCESIGKLTRREGGERIEITMINCWLDLF